MIISSDQLSAPSACAACEYVRREISREVSKQIARAHTRCRQGKLDTLSDRKIFDNR